MKLFNYTLLSSSLLFLSCIATQEATPEPIQTNLPATQISDPRLEKLAYTIEHQLEFLESVVDSMGQSIATGTAKLSAQNKKMFIQELSKVRGIIVYLKGAARTEPTLQKTRSLITLLSAVSQVLDQTLKNKFTTLPAFDESSLLKKNQILQDASVEKLVKIVKANDKKLKKIATSTETIGLNSSNLMYRSFRAFAKKVNLYGIAEHAMVYGAFLSWCVFILPQQDIDNLSNSYLRGLFQTIKPFVGQPVYPQQHTNTINRNINAQGLPAGAPAVLSTESVGTITESIQITQDAGSSERKLANNVVTLANSPVVTIPVGSLFAAYFLKDAQYLYAKFTELRNKLDDYLYGTTKKYNYAESSIPKERFKDIVGREEIKAELQKIVDYLVNPDRFDRAGIKISRGWLFAGSPQTGKTLMARALAGEISDAFEKAGKTQKVRFFDISTDHLRKKGIAYFINLAKQFAPCILFFDELDLARLQRDGDSGLLSEFLQAMSEGLTQDEKDQVYILGATNKVTNLDFALMQPGRFGKVIYFEKPTFQHRIDYLKAECEKRGMFLDKFDFTYLAQITEGCHFGALRQVVRTACMTAKVEQTAVNQKHFEHAIDVEIRRIILDSPAMSDDKAQLIATHQAGKALISMLLQPVKQLCQVTIHPVVQELEEEHVSQQYSFGPHHPKKEQRVIRQGDIFSCHAQDSLGLISQEELAKECKILVAGAVAQMVMELPGTVFDQTDTQQAFELSKKIVFEGVKPETLPKAIREEKLAQAYAYIKAAEAEVKELLTQHKAKLEAIIKELVARKTLTLRDLKLITDQAASNTATPAETVATPAAA